MTNSVAPSDIEGSQPQLSQNQQQQAEQSQPGSSPQSTSKKSRKQQQQQQLSKINLDPNEQTVTLPLARIKKIMNEEAVGNGTRVQGEAIVAAAACTEVWLDYFIQHIYQYTKRDGRKGISYKDVALAVREVDQFEFLDDIVPMKVPTQQAVDERNATIPQSRLQKHQQQLQQQVTLGVEGVENADTEMNQE
ncbi:hypothetical protein MIR68_003299 [Amoeboaphelidium protococcarum]|nr:hypothetical protein MIR68_003299 [Amoeboaphelidium protococcarum]